MGNLQNEAQEALNKGKKGEDKTVEISEVDLKGLVSTVQALQQDLAQFKKGGNIELPSVKTRKARVHFFNDKVITNIGQAWEIKDERGNFKMRLEIYVGGKKHEVDYKDYFESVEKKGFISKDLVIKEIKVIDEGIKDLGYVDKVEVDYDGFRTKTTGRVPLRVIVPEYSYVMELEDGETIEVNPLALN
jgi:hypothetical protein